MAFCEALVPYRLVLKYNAMQVLSTYECPRLAESGSKFCVVHRRKEQHDSGD